MEKVSWKWAWHPRLYRCERRRNVKCLIERGATGISERWYGKSARDTSLEQGLLFSAENMLLDATRGKEEAVGYKNSWLK